MILREPVRKWTRSVSVSPNSFRCRPSGAPALTRYVSTIVQFELGYRIMTLVTTKITCEELERLKSKAASAFRDAQGVRFSRDVSIYEDAELYREWNQLVFSVIKHLLVGHDGDACPAGSRPIIRARKPEIQL